MPRELIAIGPRSPSLREYVEEPLQSNQMRIESIISAVKHGTELRGYRAESRDYTMPFDWNRGIHAGPPKPPRFPIRLGNATVGRVVEKGKKVNRFALGDVVYGHLPIRETHSVTENRVQKVPDGMTHEAVLAWDPACVALGAVRDAGIGIGDRVALFGLGAIGQMALQLARLQGARWVSGSDPLALRRKLAEENGADLIVDPVDQDAGLAIRERTEDLGVDVSLECSGSYGGLNDALRAARYSGTVVSLAYYTGSQGNLHLAGEWHRNRLTLLSSRDVSQPLRGHPRWTTERLHEEAFLLLREGKLRAQGLLQPVVPFGESAEAFRLIDERPEESIKLAVIYPG